MVHGWEKCDEGIFLPQNALICISEAPLSTFYGIPTVFHNFGVIHCTVVRCLSCFRFWRNCEQSCPECSRACHLVHMCTGFSKAYTQEWNCRFIGRTAFILVYACCPSVIINKTPLILQSICIWMVSCMVSLVTGWGLSPTLLANSQLFSKVLYQVPLPAVVYETSHCLSSPTVLVSLSI